MRTDKIYVKQNKMSIENNVAFGYVELLHLGWYGDVMLSVLDRFN